MNNNTTQNTGLNTRKLHKVNCLLLEIDELSNAIKREQTLIRLALKQLDLPVYDVDNTRQCVDLLLNHCQSATQPLLENVAQAINRAKTAFSESLKVMAETQSQ